MTHRLALPLMLTATICVAASCNRDALTVPEGDLGGAADGGGSGLPTTAYVSRTCAPNDGIALSLVIYSFPIPECSADPERRNIQIVLYGPDVPPQTTPATITSTGSAVRGTLTDCLGGTRPCRTTQDFRVTFDRYGLQQPADGRFSATFPDGILDGTFNATWCEPVPPRCG